MEKQIISMICMGLMFLNLSSQTIKEKELTLGLGLAMNTINGPEGIHVTTPTFKMVIPFSDKFQFTTDYTQFTKFFNTSKTLSGAAFRFSAQVILINLEMLQLYATVGYNTANIRFDESGTSFSGFSWGIGFKSKMKKQHIFYEERFNYSHFDGYTTVQKTNDASMGMYREITFKYEREKHKKTKQKNMNHLKGKWLLVH